MQHLVTSLIYLLIGLGLITTLEITISILSRKINLSYSYFSMLSLVIYFTITYLLYKRTNSMFAAMIVVILIGLYDGRIGWIISNKLRADLGKHKEFLDKMTATQIASTTVLISIICGWIAILVASL